MYAYCPFLYQTIVMKELQELYLVFNTFQVLPNGNLVFPPFRAEDYRQEVHAQVYVCLARNSVGSIHSRDVNVRAGEVQTILVEELRWIVFFMPSRSQFILHSSTCLIGQIHLLTSHCSGYFA